MSGIIPRHILKGKDLVPNPEYSDARYEISFLDINGKADKRFPPIRSNDPKVLEDLMKQGKPNQP